MKKHDILCLQESKTDDLDVIEINGFEIKMKNMQGPDLKITDQLGKTRFEMKILKQHNN